LEVLTNGVVRKARQLLQRGIYGKNTATVILCFANPQDLLVVVLASWLVGIQRVQVVAESLHTSAAIETFYCEYIGGVTPRSTADSTGSRFSSF
jgi:hypothetical protein